ncbi:hypothetical protein F0562_001441 [Nyssa sinensis]|uniref:Retroviral polymerase SH3-like domain-containing protein n=1 Tax=Nyssa sinensis TaxID=561372 RepID=A0A5J5C7C2_9ASTE|nr:hypothetical protein F0562_001441 [Nyssa sinensis]
MNGGSSVSVDKLVGNNYSYWKLCMEAYLQGQDLWDLISGDDVVIPEDTPKNAELRRKWKIKCGKALFALRTSISQEYIQHVRDGKSPKQVWETLERLFTQKNMMRLQFLENQLAGMTQDNLSISEYFLKIKTLCSEISELDTEEPVSDARLRRYLIRGLRKEFMPFIFSIQGWANQSSIIELENLLSNQEALMKQMASRNKQSPSQVEDALYTKDKAKSNSFSKHSSGDNKQSKTEGQSRGNSRSCYRKGWRCMDLETKKVVVSRDVVFDEVSSHQIDANPNKGTADLSPFFSDDASSEKGSNTTSSGETIQQDEDIQLQKIRTEAQVADIFTKTLTKAKFEVFRSALGVVDIKFALRGSVAN